MDDRTLRKRSSQKTKENTENSPTNPGVSTVTSSSHCRPENCNGQWHFGPVKVLKHVPPFRHTLSEQELSARSGPKVKESWVMFWALCSSSSNWSGRMAESFRLVASSSSVVVSSFKYSTWLDSKPQFCACTKMLHEKRLLSDICSRRFALIRNW